MSVSAACLRPGPVRHLSPEASAALAQHVMHVAGWSRVYRASAFTGNGGWLIAGRKGNMRVVAAGYVGRPPAYAKALGPAWRQPDGVMMCAGPATHSVLTGLRNALPFLRPQVAGRRSSFGFGDRLGLATPGHLAAVTGTGLFPVLAQQSMREMKRSGRTPMDVMDDATFGVLEAGWTGGYGADADHLKTPGDVARCAAAGFVMFTLDGTDVLDPDATTLEGTPLLARAWDVIRDVPGGGAWAGRYLDQQFEFRGPHGPVVVRFGEDEFYSAVVRYGRLIEHFTRLAADVRRETRGRPYELEVSIDELPVETSPTDHLFIARELALRGVMLHSLAPRFAGRFEKGVDFRGDLGAFRCSLAVHAAIARGTGGYKLSLHSGSDKFSIYRVFARETKGYFHVKTAGTSYLEALLVIALADPRLFREIAAFSRRQYGRDRASYHVSADLSRVPRPDDVTDRRLAQVFLGRDDGRQVLHVGFGSVLSERSRQGFRFRTRIMDLLERDAGAYTLALRRHLGRHARLLRVSPKAGMLH